MAETKNFNPIDSQEVFTIPNTSDTSNSIDFLGARLLGLLHPAALTGTVLEIEGSLDGVTFFKLVNTAGVILSVPFSASRGMTFVPADFAGWRFLRLVSNSVEGADRMFTAQLRPLS